MQGPELRQRRSMLLRLKKRAVHVNEGLDTVPLSRRQTSRWRPRSGAERAMDQSGLISEQKSSAAEGEPRLHAARTLAHFRCCRMAASVWQQPGERTA